MNYDASNEMFSLAVNLVNQSSRNIFLTGKAGTGKTTFLRFIRENCSKQMAIVAPTGVAAINAGGVTIHSFFQLPLTPFIPEAKGFSKKTDETMNRNSLISHLRINREKRKVLQQLELLVIDEISMVRCDIMDAIDTVLRYVRKRPQEKFGGVQVLLIGDMFQLPPVTKDPEWRVLSEFYDGPYFFDSYAMEEPPVYIEFGKIYRQSDERFINLLNQVRNNEMTEQGLRILEERYQPSFRRADNDGYIILTTHNDGARHTNTNELARLTAPVFNYRATVKGDFPESAYPADMHLQLKVGAQVMFIKNDTEKLRRYFNGKIGTVTTLSEDRIRVRCKDEAEDIEVKKEEWDNIRYSLNSKTRQLEEEVLGSFIQYPLRLAWAITIHKSQGLTFDKVVVDAGEAFAAGQVYVALSRCTNLNGLVLKSRIRPGSLFTDPRVVEFSRQHTESSLVSDELNVSRKDYQEKLLLSTFDFRIPVGHCGDLLAYAFRHRASFNKETIFWLEDLVEKIGALQKTADKFHLWLQQQFQQSRLPGENLSVQDKTVKAAAHFVIELSSLIECLHQSPVASDSHLRARDFNEGLKEIFAELALKKFLLESYNGQLDPEEWHTRRKNFVLPSFNINIHEGGTSHRLESPHPILHIRLRKLRDAFCAPRDLPVYMVAAGKTIDEMARFLPQTLEELGKIGGFGEAKIERYGQDFLDIIVDYCKERGLGSLIHERAPKRLRKPGSEGKDRITDTKAESFRLYREGLSVSEIARERRLTAETIEGHLAFFVSQGKININELVSKEKLVEIEPVIKDYEGGPITPIKERLGKDIGFGDIRLALAWKEYEKSRSL